MRYFDRYVSNTTAGSGNQSVSYCGDPCLVRTARVYYKLFCAGEFEYSLLYSNTVDSTFADGSVSKKNKVCGEWRIESLKAGVCFGAGSDTAAEPETFIELTFDGKKDVYVAPGALIYTDGFHLDVPDGAYICVELAFSGKMTPCFPESIIPSFMQENGLWNESTDFPFPSMIGCTRQVKAMIGYLGDSITEGIGTDIDSYMHWNAVASAELGSDYAYWNLGLGYAHAYDAASDGMWLYKARQNDIVVVCLGVNDLLSGVKSAEIIADLETTVKELRTAGCKVIVQTVPPFDYEGAVIVEWERVNSYITDVLSEKADGVFDVVPVLMGGERHIAKYGGHPNAEGCEAWGKALYPVIKRVAEAI